MKLLLKPSEQPGTKSNIERALFLGHEVHDADGGANEQQAVVLCCAIR